MSREGESGSEDVAVREEELEGAELEEDERRGSVSDEASAATDFRLNSLIDTMRAVC